MAWRTGIALLEAPAPEVLQLPRRQLDPLPNPKDIPDHLGLGCCRQQVANTEDALLVAVLRHFAEHSCFLCAVHCFFVIISSGVTTSCQLVAA